MTSATLREFTTITYGEANVQAAKNWFRSRKPDLDSDE
jgi:hypothetical protein